MLRTSETHPLQIGELNVLNGKIGLTFCPGKKQETSLTGGWNRDVDTDIAAIKAWGADVVISLLEPHEYIELGVAELARKLHDNFRWLQVPMPDKCAPGILISRCWKSYFSRLVLHHLVDGKNILIHCKGGFGRTGTVAAMILIDTGVPVDKAVERCRAARENAVENEEQLNFLKEYARDYSNKC